MFSITKKIAAAVAVLSFAVLANAADSKEIRIAVSDVYVPNGITSQQNAYVVENGMYPNGCYRWSRAVVKHTSEFEHEIESYGMVQSGPCLMVLVPFNKEVSLGQLSRGTHKIKISNPDDTYLVRQMEIQ